ncbi:putative mitochondrial 2-oxodicarboxylate carrier [Smittium culicis]|uniref:Putative mitochondrial 2-oxodicarboxylate carrier n=1 Tax=Smittium culicis TaxID=133412 RepID=A0A1R1XWE1_9FUNG|nr:putative mitochondrial 2-oxodicarboxylate carrier [Smittium culicis]
MSESVKEQPLPFAFQFTAGAIAGVSEILCMYPLDAFTILFKNHTTTNLIKTRLMLQVGTGGDQYKSIFDAFKRIIKEEGPRTLYRGIIPPILVEAPKRAIKFAANAEYGNMYLKMFNLEKMNQQVSVLTGVSAGITEALIVSTPELLKIRLQAKENAGRYSGMTDVIKKVYATEGLKAFFNGLESTIWRHALWNGGYFGSIFMIRDLLPKPESKQGNLAVNFVAGAIGGTIGTTLNTPTDVVKTRIQAHLPSHGPKIYSSCIPGIIHIYKNEGFMALYKGYVPKVLRLGPGGGILLVVFDQVTTFMRKHFM